MNKRQFLKLSRPRQIAAVKDAAQAVNDALNLSGPETVADLMDSAWDSVRAERYIRTIITISMDFSREVIRTAKPACDLYLRYAAYLRATGAVPLRLSRLAH